MPEPPLPISLPTTRFESSNMAQSASIWHQFLFGFGVTKRERYWRFFVKLREIILGESFWSESSCLWVIEFREKEVRGCYRRSAKRKWRKEERKNKKKEEERELCRMFWSLEEVVGKKRGKKEKKEKKRVKVHVWRW